MKIPFQKTLIDAILAPQKHIIITPHDNPDGDALGSALGLAKLLSLLHPHAQIFIIATPRAQIELLEFLDPDRQIIFLQTWDPLPDAISHADTWYVVDVALKEKLSILKESFEKTTAKRICIDHHCNIPASEFDITHIDPEAAATSLLIWELWKELSQTHSLDTHTANTLYIGIISDTHNWINSNTDARSMAAGSELLSHGIDLEQIHLSLRTKKLAFHQLYARIFARLEILEISEKTIGLTHVLHSDLDELGMIENDTDGMIGDFLAIRELPVIICLIQKPDGEIRIRTRSRDGSINLHLLCQHFSGGGHERAAGGKITGKSLDEAKSLIIKTIHLVS